jgi:hypothetical protein
MMARSLQTSFVFCRNGSSAGTLEKLWRNHPLLGESMPMNLQLLEQLAPRLKSLKLRILAPMKAGPDKEQASDLLDYIAQFIQIAHEKFTLQPAAAKDTEK